ncbi:ATP-binding cassette domain-containing protein [Micromonospora olivasterospora]|uniref:ABC-type multidrug transport system ATPase subunit n=1 Tax=Micromonospora olivasterospora TaxID=1880 RepID=A0A562IA79_MICOL|nr:ATP-binding cassette domain-containing protein [Micromonospora olivasterospora]TWH67792.1 ABC-type multidrug transport system ATPase subunit [Micromonospora olivasterospora]
MSVVLDALSQGYETSTVIDNLSAALQPGITALLGPNGAGKTTLLRTLATVMPPRNGRIYIDGIQVSGEKSARFVRNRIGYLPQEFGFDPKMTVTDFVTYAAWMRGLPAKRWRRSVGEALEMVDLTDRRRSKMGSLSGGMRRRAGIAWAVVGQPRLVLLDEPTVGLDPRQRLQFRKIISGLGETVVVLSTHLIDDVGAVCDRVIVMHGGAARFDGTVAELELLGRDDLPGHSRLERAYMHLLPEGEQQL